MSINNIDSNAPASMQPWVREVEKAIKDLQATVAAQQTQINARR